MHRRALIAFLFTACRGAGGDGKGGDANDTDAPGAGLVWVDATGEVVGPVFDLEGGAPGYLDDDGFAWTFSARMTSSDQFGASETIQAGYADASCSDPWALNPAAPRVVVQTSVEPGEDPQYFVAPDDAQPRTLEPAYDLQEPNGCVEGPSRDGLPMTELLEVFSPALWWAPPLHIEER